MPRVIWTEPALNNVQRLYRFLKPQNINAARRAVAAIRGGVKVLADQPRAVVVGTGTRARGSHRFMAIASMAEPAHRPLIDAAVIARARN